MSTSLTALIVDDERLARLELKRLLLSHPHIQVIGEADSVPPAIESITQLKPDVIFLDIQMPGESGFDLLSRIQTSAQIIFVTAFDEYAIHAFEVNALDYLLKPINPKRLALAINRIRSVQEESTSIQPLEYEDRLFLNIDDKMRFVPLKIIVSIVAAGDYSEILTEDGQKGLTLKSMKEWENRLPATHFCRIHRSTIINLNFVVRTEKWFNHALRVYLIGVEEPYVISRRYVSKLKQQFS